MPRAAIRAAALLLPLVLVVMAGCTVGPADPPPIGVRGAGREQPPAAAPGGGRPLPQLEESTNDRISWTDCTEAMRPRLGGAGGGPRLECGRVVAPLDAPDRPGRGSLRLSVLRAGSGKVPLLVVNDVDEEPGTTRAARLAGQLPAEILQRFMLVGVDRRGTGGSSPADCVPPEQRRAIVGFDPAARESGPLQDLMDALRKATQRCLIDLENQFPALDAWRAAGDLNHVREALGVSRVNALGRGTGSQVLTTFAQRFPDAVGRFVLDGVPDPTTDAVGQHEARAAAAEQVFDAFAQDCVARGCPMGGDPKQTLTALLDKLRRQPIVISGGASVTAGATMRAVVAGLADRQRWAALSEALAKAASGDGSKISAMTRPLVSGQGDQPPAFDGILINTCNDTATRLPFDRLGALAAEWQGKYPLFGSFLVQQLMACSAWPQVKPLPAPRNLDVPPMVVLAGAADPVTPLTGSTRAAEQLANSALVSWQGSGHGALPTSPCATAAVQRFLVDGQVPVNKTTCPP
ncbi:alpha/beta hydrolase [Streptoalloteichus hindustanus]|uniref:TAP-like protein n=1 Tax=Streptoalloteichus hindustanus TaxID=2017 RepID=A0A1M5H5Q1_STRHI|nr:alpha/beta hydrolase [Streptoalloteichus hindustanus]SHG11331.1 TAP-like protein [Streptoalloteichus hindustanus]